MAYLKPGNRFSSIIIVQKVFFVYFSSYMRVKHIFSEGEGCVLGLAKCLERFDFLFLLKALNNFFTNIMV